MGSGEVAAMYSDGKSTGLNPQQYISTIILASLVTVFSTLVYFIMGISNHDILVMSDLHPLYLVAIIFVISFPILSILIPKRWGVAGFYLKSVSLMILAALAFVAMHSLVLFSISLVPLLAYIIVWRTTTSDVDNPVKKLVTFSVAMTFMYIAGTMFHVGAEPPSYPSTFAPISEVYVFSSAGVPFFLKGGIEFITPYVQGVFSPLSFIIFTAISAILTENYFGIFGLLRKQEGKTKISGSAYGAVSLLSCQCEGGISLLPTMAYLVITIAMVPVLTESLALLLLTNILINRYYLNGTKVDILNRIGNPRGKAAGITVAALLFLGTPLVETFGIYLGLISNIFFFFGIGILMTVSAYYEAVFLGRLLGYNRKLNSAVLVVMFALAPVLMFIWYFPHFTMLAVSQVSMFLVMNATSIVAGFLFGLIKLSSRRAVGQLLEEFIALMFGMPPIIVFYISALKQLQIWPIFNITQQVEFGLVVWALILPFMWITTNISLNDARENFVTRAASRH